MCHLTCISTTSIEDFAGVDDVHFRLEWLGDGSSEPSARFLEYPNKWFLSGKYGGCSCHFRNFMRGWEDLGFHEELDWSPEDEEDVESTRAFYDFMVRVVSEGNKLDTVTVWTGDEPFDRIWTRDVSLSEVSREAFLFLDDYRYRIGP
jgi:hypothetical protein